MFGFAWGGLLRGKVIAPDVGKVFDVVSVSSFYRLAQAIFNGISDRY